MQDEKSSAVTSFFLERPDWIDSQQFWYAYQTARFAMPLALAWITLKIMRDAPAPSMILTGLMVVMVLALSYLVIIFFFRLLARLIEYFMG